MPSGGHDGTAYCLNSACDKGHKGRSLKLSLLAKSCVGYPDIWFGWVLIPFQNRTQYIGSSYREARSRHTENRSEACAAHDHGM